MRKGKTWDVEADGGPRVITHLKLLATLAVQGALPSRLLKFGLG
jgi:hypothetical protein